MTTSVEQNKASDITRLSSTLLRLSSRNNPVADAPTQELPHTLLAASLPVKKLSMIIEERVEEEKKVEKKEKPPKKKREVVMSYKINCVSDISAILGTVEVDLKVFFHWSDEALIGRPNGTTIDTTEKGLFDPDMIITNDHNISEISSVAKVTESETGGVKISKHYKGSVFLTSMDLKLFPFDCQNLQTYILVKLMSLLLKIICFKPYKKSIEEVVMIPSDPAECAMESRIAQEWDILGHCMKVFETDPATSSAKKVYSTIYLTVLTRRKAGWFVANIFVPTFLMLVVSWLTFIYEPHGARSDRNDVSMSTLLLSISNKFVVGDAMPKVDYRTLVDIYVDTCFYLQVLTMLANAVVEKYQDMPCLGRFGRHLNLTFFLLELIAAFCLHEWFFVSLFNHRADILDWVEASKSRPTVAEVEAENQSHSEIDRSEDEFDESLDGIEDTHVVLPVRSSAPKLFPVALTDIDVEKEFSEGDDQYQSIDVDGIRNRSSRRRSFGSKGIGVCFDDSHSSEWNAQNHQNGLVTPPYKGYIQSHTIHEVTAELEEDASPSNHASSRLSPLTRGIMRQRPPISTGKSSAFASSSSSFFSAEKKKRKTSISAIEDSPSGDLETANKREVYKSRPRRISSVSTLLIFIERVAGPASQWVVGEPIVSSNGIATVDDGVARRRQSSPHFTDFGALGMLTPHQSLEKGERSITEARRLETTMQNERANVVSEIFKRTARDKELKNALAHRKEREDEKARVREIRINEFKQDITSKGPLPGSSHSQSEKILEREKDMNASSHGDRDIEGQVEEEYIRDMASRVLQARWRIMRARRQVIVLRDLRNQALLEGYATRIQRTFRLRIMIKNSAVSSVKEGSLSATSVKEGKDMI